MGHQIYVAPHLIAYLHRALSRDSFHYVKKKRCNINHLTKAPTSF